MPDETRSKYCHWFLSVQNQMSPIPRTPSGVLVRQILKNTLKLLSESDRAQIIQKHEKTVALLYNYQTNDGKLRIQQQGKQVVDNVKTILTKIDPKTEFVSSNECLELVS